jgi:hypothetical protein
MEANGALLDPDLVAGRSRGHFPWGVLFFSALPFFWRLRVCGGALMTGVIDFLKHAARRCSGSLAHHPVGTFAPK